MAFFILGTGAFLSVKLGFFQFTHLGRALRAPFRAQRVRGLGGVSPFQALATALGASIGTANIAGVAGAIALGGPGAVLWMWAAALVGMATKLCEIILAMKYRDASSKPPVGGAMLCMEGGLGRLGRPLSLCFCTFGSLAALVGTALVQSNTIAEAGIGLVRGFGFSAGGRLLPMIFGVITSAAAGAVVLGGARRIGEFSARAVPFMALLYALACAVCIVLNRSRLLPALGSIVRGAFGARPVIGAAFGAGLGKAVRVGVARGVYSNEAGVGSSSMAHAGSAQTDPVKQGLLGIFEVFADTCVMCSLTALVILTSGTDIKFGASAGMGLAGDAFSSVFGAEAASLLLCVCVLLFAFTSLIGWSLYGERCVYHIIGSSGVIVFRLFFLVLIPVGAVIKADLAWKLGELFNYLMAIPNLIMLILLSGEAKRLVLQYKMFEKSSRRGYNKE